MKLSCPKFSNNDYIPINYTCDGENINPPLIIEDVPDDAASMVLIAEDPDAPSGTFTHWVVWNIPPEVGEIPENSVPSGSAEGMTSSGTRGYEGPCPPSGTHHYHFKLYALDSLLDLNDEAIAEEIQEAMEGHVIDETELIGLYERQG